MIVVGANQVTNARPKAITVFHLVVMVVVAIGSVTAVVAGSLLSCQDAMDIADANKDKLLDDPREYIAFLNNLVAHHAFENYDYEKLPQIFRDHHNNYLRRIDEAKRLKTTESWEIVFEEFCSNTTTMITRIFPGTSSIERNAIGQDRHGNTNKASEQAATPVKKRSRLWRRRQLQLIRGEAKFSYILTPTSVPTENPIFDVSPGRGSEAPEDVLSGESPSPTDTNQAASSQEPSTVLSGDILNVQNSIVLVVNNKAKHRVYHPLTDAEASNIPAQSQSPLSSASSNMLSSKLLPSTHTRDISGHSPYPSQTNSPSHHLGTTFLSSSRLGQRSKTTSAPSYWPSPSSKPSIHPSYSIQTPNPTGEPTVSPSMHASSSSHTSNPTKASSYSPTIDLSSTKSAHPSYSSQISNPIQAPSWSPSLSSLPSIHPSDSRSSFGPLPSEASSQLSSRHPDNQNSEPSEPSLSEHPSSSFIPSFVKGLSMAQSDPSASSTSIDFRTPTHYPTSSSFPSPTILGLWERVLPLPSYQPSQSPSQSQSPSTQSGVSGTEGTLNVFAATSHVDNQHRTAAPSQQTEPNGDPTLISYPSSTLLPTTFHSTVSPNPSSTRLATTSGPTANMLATTTGSPTFGPTTSPPSPVPSWSPSSSPTGSPTTFPSAIPNMRPSASPSKSPTSHPSETPTTTSPSDIPSYTPSTTPSASPSVAASSFPSPPPTEPPTEIPSSIPSYVRSESPTESPYPSGLPSFSPSQSQSPSSLPSNEPSSSSRPSEIPSSTPTVLASSVSPSTISELPSETHLFNALSSDNQSGQYEINESTEESNENPTPLFTPTDTNPTTLGSGSEVPSKSNYLSNYESAASSSSIPTSQPVTASANNIFLASEPHDSTQREEAPSLTPTSKPTMTLSSIVASSILPTSTNSVDESMLAIRCENFLTALNSENDQDDEIGSIKRLCDQIFGDSFSNSVAFTRSPTSQPTEKEAKVGPTPDMISAPMASQAGTVEDSSHFQSQANISDAAVPPELPANMGNASHATATITSGVTTNFSNVSNATALQAEIFNTDSANISNASSEYATDQFNMGADRNIKGYNTWVVSNTAGLSASFMRESPHFKVLERVYAIFVGQVVSDMFNQSSPLVPPSRRHLTVLFAQESAEIFKVIDSTCPDPGSGTVQCQTAFGQVDLYITGENTKSVYSAYVNFSQRAISEGKLQNILDEIDPDSILSIVSIPSKSREDRNASEATSAITQIPREQSSGGSDPGSSPLLLILLISSIAVFVFILFLFVMIVKFRRIKREREKSEESVTSTAMNDIFMEKNSGGLESDDGIPSYIHPLALQYKDKASNESSVCSILDETDTIDDNDRLLRGVKKGVLIDIADDGNSTGTQLLQRADQASGYKQVSFDQKGLYSASLSSIEANLGRCVQIARSASSDEHPENPERWQKKARGQDIYRSNDREADRQKNCNSMGFLMEELKYKLSVRNSVRRSLNEDSFVAPQEANASTQSGRETLFTTMKYDRASSPLTNLAHVEDSERGSILSSHQELFGEALIENEQWGHDVRSSSQGALKNSELGSCVRTRLTWIREGSQWHQCLAVDQDSKDASEETEYYSDETDDGSTARWVLENGEWVRR